VTFPAIVIRLELEQAPRLYIDAAHEEDARRLMRWIDGNRELLDLVIDAKILEARPRADLTALESIVGDPDPGELVLPWGRHRGRSIAEVYADDPEGVRGSTTGRGYVRWLASEAVRDASVRGGAIRFLGNVAPELLR
jgi:hypothetical protein